MNLLSSLEKQNKELKIVRYITMFFGSVTVVATVVLLVCLLAGSYFVEFGERNQSKGHKVWEAQWTIEDVTEEELDFLRQQGVKLSGRYITASSAKLPRECHYQEYLLLSIVYSDVWFYVDEEPFGKEELRYVFYPESESAYAKTGYSARRTIPLQDTDDGKYLTVLQVADDDVNFISNKEIVYGDKFGLQWNYISENYVSFVTNLCLLVFSVVFLVIGLGACMVFRKVLPIVYLLIGIFNLALWAVTNSFTMELLFDNWHLMYDLLYLSDFLMPLALVLYLDSVQEHRYRKVYFVCEIIYVPTMLVGIVLYICNICSLHDFFMKTIVLYVAQIVVILCFVVLDIIRKNVAKYKYVLIGFVLLALFGLLQILNYMTNGNQMTLPFLSLGIILLLIMCLAETARDLLYTIEEKTAAESASKAKSDVLARMSHEIRTPINAITGMNEMILRTSAEKQSRQYAEEVKRATDLLMDIVNDILDFSKMESGKMELLPVEYNSADLLLDMVNLFAPKAEEKKVEFQTIIDSKLPRILYGDSIKIHQILSNIISNAVKYTKRGRIEFHVGATVEGEYVTLHVKVKDTGIGIKPENMDKLFAEFERIEEFKTRNITGTGLGLSITKRLLQMMDSALYVESVYGEGSEFYFDLRQPIRDREPIGDFSKYQRQLSQKETYHSLFTAPEAKILVVDDNRVNLKVFRSLLQDTKMQIDEVESGELCLEMVRKKRYDMIFLDYMMPGMDGIETLHRIRQSDEYLCENTPIIALTAAAVGDAREFYLAQGFDEYIPKPFSSVKLEQMVQAMLPKHLLSPAGENEEETEQEERHPEERHGEAPHDEEKYTEKTVTEIVRYVVEKGSLPDIEGVNWDKALAYFNSKKTMLDSLEDFYQTMGMEARKLQECYANLSEAAEAGAETESYFRLYKVQVHSMKGVTKLFGIMSESNAAKVLEDAANEKNLEFVQKHHAEFMDKWYTLKNRLKPWLEKETEKQRLNAEFVIGQLEVLKTALDGLDVNGMDVAMKEIKGFAFPENMASEMDRLNACVTDLDSEEGIAIIENLIEKINTEGE